MPGVGERLTRDFLLCREELERVVACRKVVDELEAAKAPPEEIAAAVQQLDIVSASAARTVADLRHRVNRQKEVAQLIDVLTVGSFLLATAVTIVMLAFPPATLLCVGIAALAAGSSLSCSLFTGVLLRDIPSRPTREAMSRWAKLQPPEPLAGAKAFPEASVHRPAMRDHTTTGMKSANRAAAAR